MPSIFLIPNFSFIVLFVILVWLAVITALHIRSERRFHKFSKGVSKKDLRTILTSIQKQAKLSQEEISNIKQSIKKINQDSLSHFQNIGFLRYNPFKDTGGDQSFILCLLDGHASGIVISSLHSRDQTRIYAKKITKGKSPGYTLSKEERAIIKQAKNK